MSKESIKRPQEKKTNKKLAASATKEAEFHPEETVGLRVIDPAFLHDELLIAKKIALQLGRTQRNRSFQCCLNEDGPSPSITTSVPQVQRNMLD